MMACLKNECNLIVKRFLSSGSEFKKQEVHRTWKYMFYWLFLPPPATGNPMAADGRADDSSPKRE